MAYEISVNHPGYPEGTELALQDVVAVPNGGSVVLSELQEQRFIQKYGSTPDEWFAQKDEEGKLVNGEMFSVKSIQSVAAAPVAPDAPGTDNTTKEVEEVKTT